MTTRATLRSWLEEGAKKGASHLLVVYDPVKERDYPVWVCPPESVAEVYKTHRAVAGVYALHLDWETQLDETPAFHFESVPSDHHLTWGATPEKAQEQVDALYYPALAASLRELYFNTCKRHEMQAPLFSSYFDSNVDAIRCEFWCGGKKIDRALPMYRLTQLHGFTVTEVLELFVTRAVFDVAHEMGK